MELEKFRAELERNNLQIARLISDFKSEKDTRTETNNRIYQKLDTIIERNFNADKQIGILLEKITTHSKEDEDEFKEIKKKHNSYDNFIIWALAYGVTQLVGVILLLIFK